MKYPYMVYCHRLGGNGRVSKENYFKTMEELQVYLDQTIEDKLVIKLEIYYLMEEKYLSRTNNKEDDQSS